MKKTSSSKKMAESSRQDNSITLSDIINGFKYCSFTSNELELLLLFINKLDAKLTLERGGAVNIHVSELNKIYEIGSEFSIKRYLDISHELLKKVLLIGDNDFITFPLFKAVAFASYDKINECRKLLGKEQYEIKKDDEKYKPNKTLTKNSDLRNEDLYLLLVSHDIIIPYLYELKDLLKGGTELSIVAATEAERIKEK